MIVIPKRQVELPDANSEMMADEPRPIGADECRLGSLRHFCKDRDRATAIAGARRPNRAFRHADCHARRVRDFVVLPDRVAFSKNALDLRRRLR